MARDLHERCETCGGSGVLDKEAVKTLHICVDPPGALKIERLADGAIVCPFCKRGFIQTGLTMAQVERRRHESVSNERGPYTRYGSAEPP